MASDEHANTYFTSSVYFRPDEIDPGLRNTFSMGKISRAVVAEFFHISISRDTLRRVAVDPANSVYCEGNYVDGNWLYSNPKCKHRLAYMEVNRLSPYITVRVDTALSRSGIATAEK